LVSNSLIDLLGLDLPTDGEQEKPVGEAVISLTAAEKGSYGNSLVLRTETKTQQVSATASEDYYNAYVILNGKEVSVYQRVSWDDATSAKFLPTLLANDLYLNMEAEDEDGNFVLEMLPDGDWALGTDELPEGVSSLTANVIDYTNQQEVKETSFTEIQTLSTQSLSSLVKVLQSGVRKLVREQNLLLTELTLEDL
jgi:hypothetical protein